MASTSSTIDTPVITRPELVQAFGALVAVEQDPEQRAGDDRSEVAEGLEQAA